MRRPPPLTNLPNPTPTKAPGAPTLSHNTHSPQDATQHPARALARLPTHLGTDQKSRNAGRTATLTRGSCIRTNSGVYTVLLFTPSRLAPTLRPAWRDIRTCSCVSALWRGSSKLKQKLEGTTMLVFVPVLPFCATLQN